MTPFGNPEFIEAYIQHLESRLHALESANANTLTPSTPPVVTPKEPKLANPILINGQKKLARTFMLQVKNCIKVQPSRFENDLNKVSFAISFLRGSAFDWISPYLETDYAMLSNFAAFETAFLLAFGDIDRKKHAEGQIFTLRQGNRPVAVVPAEFQKLAFRLFERKREGRVGNRTIITNPAPVFVETPIDAMQIDNVQRRGPLSADEKERRKRLDLCLY